MRRKSEGSGGEWESRWWERRGVCESERSRRETNGLKLYSSCERLDLWVALAFFVVVFFAVLFFVVVFLVVVAGLGVASVAKGKKKGKNVSFFVLSSRSFLLENDQSFELFR